jgi:hypothetical protein
MGAGARERACCRPILESSASACNVTHDLRATGRQDRGLFCLNWRTSFALATAHVLGKILEAEQCHLLRRQGQLLHQVSSIRSSTKKLNSLINTNPEQLAQWPPQARS